MAFTAITDNKTKIIAITSLNNEDGLRLSSQPIVLNIFSTAIIAASIIPEGCKSGLKPDTCCPRAIKRLKTCS